MNLPDPVGDPIVIREKVYIPVDDHPDVSFVSYIVHVAFSSTLLVVSLVPVE